MPLKSRGPRCPVAGDAVRIYAISVQCVVTDSVLVQLLVGSLAWYFLSKYLATLVGVLSSMMNLRHELILLQYWRHRQLLEWLPMTI